MKRNDLALIAVVIAFSAVISLVVSKMIFATPANTQQEVEVVQPISADFPAPDSRYFNKESFDPTKLITIGQNNNPDPFNGSDTSQ
jgi:hypothetical protein